VGEFNHMLAKVIAFEKSIGLPEELSAARRARRRSVLEWANSATPTPRGRPISILVRWRD